MHVALELDLLRLPGLGGLDQYAAIVAAELRRGAGHELQQCVGALDGFDAEALAAGDDAGLAEVEGGEAAQDLRGAGDVVLRGLVRCGAGVEARIGGERGQDLVRADDGKTLLLKDFYHRPQQAVIAHLQRRHQPGGDGGHLGVEGRGVERGAHEGTGEDHAVDACVLHGRKERADLLEPVALRLRLELAGDALERDDHGVGVGAGNGHRQRAGAGEDRELSGHGQIEPGVRKERSEPAVMKLTIWRT